MLLGYLALTEITTEKEIQIYYGNQCAVDYPTIKSRFKIHLLPPDIEMITLVNKNFTNGEIETEAVLTIKEAIDSGFFQKIDSGKDFHLPPVIMPKLVKIKKRT